jgi:alpha-tubulin suppressor-like RCC1 family protein
VGAFAGPDGVESGLVLSLDAGNSKSYPGSGTTWTDLTNNGRNGTLTNGPTYSSANGGSIVFDGIDDFVSSVSNLTLANNFSVSLWLKHINSYSVQEKYISLGSDRIVIQSNENGNLSSYVTDSTQQNLLVWGVAISVGTNDTTPTRFTPVTTFAGGTTWKSVSSGGYYTAAIKTDGTLWTWGYNAKAQLGINNTANQSIPVTTFAGGNNWKQIACGGYDFTSGHMAAIKTDGSLWVWGGNAAGQLGINNTAQRNTPVTTFAGGTDWKSVACGHRHTSAIKTDGSLWTWGSNGGGQLGINNTANRSIPVTTFTGGTNWKQVSAGEQHTVAIKTDGTLWTWGGNDSGQLGDNTVTNRSTPVTTFAGGNNWKQVSAGWKHTAAIKTDGSLWGWGLDQQVQLGLARGTGGGGFLTPVTTFAGGNNWKSVSAGFYHTAAIKTDGTLWTWGQQINNVGTLGVNDSTGFASRNVPVTTFAGGNNWKQVSGGQSVTAAIKTDGTFINDDDSNISLLNTKYYNISLTCNGTTIKIHLDSVEILSTTISGTLTSTDISFTISSLLDCFKGNISQVSIYNRALTTTEIQQNFNATKSRYF